MEGEDGGNALGTEGAGVFLFIQELDFTNPHAVVIEVEILGVIDGVAEFDLWSDIGRGHLIEGAFETDGGVIIDEAFVADEEDLVEFSFREATELYPGYGCIVAVDGFISDAVMELVVVVLLEPQPESLVEFLESDSLLDAGKEAFTDSSEEAFYFSTGGAVVGFGVDEGDAGHGAALGEQV